MAGMRNILVHGYLSVDAEIIADVVETRLGDLLSFAESVRARVSTKG